MQSCLIVIDAQESFRHRPYYHAGAMDAYLVHQNALIEGCVQRGVPVARVLHVEPDAPANPFALASGHVRPLDALAAFTPAFEAHKSRHSALVGTGLDVWLIREGVRRVIISGIRTEQCCETTARHASDLGWEVDYVADATLTFDMLQPDGTPLSAADITARTVTVLHERFATVCTVQQALARAGSGS
ncbi:isochorismatase family protein [Massilia sp. PAMC28688]|uniref:isochorismatase family protein n=1 Tax=Massilia sp. PAMC28688 TaxID=2861283 RepID=UPI001C62D9DA|nr:isochorismatase family protein [Massilia sp. PAMC28688]QYF95363.1 isochorismatase family protein [Massilia sp. PAMC28688]